MLADIAEIFIRLGLTAAPDDLTDANGDLIWPQGKTSAGYGVFNGEYVHRLVCEWANGPIPDDWTVDHVWEAGCRSRACFLPAHLEAVTSGENTRRVFAALRSTGRRQCGHPWGNGNDRANGQCKVCHRVSEARRRALDGGPQNPDRGTRKTDFGTTGERLVEAGNGKERRLLSGDSASH